MASTNRKTGVIIIRVVIVVISEPCRERETTSKSDGRASTEAVCAAGRKALLGVVISCINDDQVSRYVPERSDMNEKNARY